VTGEGVSPANGEDDNDSNNGNEINHKVTSSGGDADHTRYNQKEQCRVYSSEDAVQLVRKDAVKN
jgi:hypothetical protein